MTNVVQMFRSACVGLVLALTIIVADPLHAVSVPVKYVGLVDLDSFDCTQIARSSFIRSVCHERSSATTVVQLNTTWYQYCGIPHATIQDWLSAPSMGRFYNRHIKGAAYAC